MPARQPSFPVRFTPRGLTDAFDATDTFPGACLSLANLIFDPSNPEIMVSRPGVGTAVTDFTGFSSPDVVSVHITVGERTYGMIATARNSGKDEPFCYNHATGAFETVSGVTNGNSPTTQPYTGEWTPPTMAVVGVYVIVTHPGFPGGATKFGWFDITTPTAPAWNAGDTTSNGLASTPLCVANFNNRAYFGCTNGLPYTDVLTLTRTSAGQALTIGDTADITALSGLPVQTTSSGIVQALLVFKENQVWQVTGDSATSNLAQNYLSLTTGCASPRSIAQSPQGVYFAATSGPMVVDQSGALRWVVHGGQESQPDVRSGWSAMATPSRTAGGFTGSIYRLSMDTVIRGNSVTNDYWFAEQKRRWTGPNSFTYDCVSQYGSNFVLCSNDAPAKLFLSEPYPSNASTYLDNGAAISTTMQSSTFPKVGDMVVKQVVESTQELASSGGSASYTVTALDEIGNTINSCSVAVAPAGTLWGSGVWGGFSWASSTNIPKTYTVPWGVPLIFKKMALYITATASGALSIGTFFARWKESGYLNTP